MILKYVPGAVVLVGLTLFFSILGLATHDFLVWMLTL
jgi:hypothetical protein